MHFARNFMRGSGENAPASKIWYAIVRQIRQIARFQLFFKLLFYE